MTARQKSSGTSCGDVDRTARNVEETALPMSCTPEERGEYMESAFAFGCSRAFPGSAIVGETKLERASSRAPPKRACAARAA